MRGGHPSTSLRFAQDARRSAQNACGGDTIRFGMTRHEFWYDFSTVDRQRKPSQESDGHVHFQGIQDWLHVDGEGAFRTITAGKVQPNDVHGLFFEPK